MNKVIREDGLPIKLWLDDIEDGALDQAKNLAELPFVFKHIAIMPDAHQGYGMPIGGVMATKEVVVPNAVGVDIGCGMCVVKTSLTDIDIDTIKKIMGEIRNTIPVGFAHQSKKQNDDLMPPTSEIRGEVLSEYHVKNYPIVSQEYNSATKQIGTLGGGNHFIELQKGLDGHIYIMIHSGSRNLGYKVARHYNDIAIDLNKKWFSSVPKEHELAFLPLDSEEGCQYLDEMQYCVDFALANRKLMMDRILECFCNALNLNIIDYPRVYTPYDKKTNKYTAKKDFKVEPMINIAHNYAKMEHHFGQNVMIHRKGATLARKGTIGIIPGSQGTKSYIVEGLGNPESFMSCSHGAGRRMGRKQAKRELNLQDEIKKLDSQGIVHGIRNENDLDEASGAYKPIEKVMANQSDLVKILVELTPLGVIKG